jgi:hypothetical protein
MAGIQSDPLSYVASLELPAPHVVEGLMAEAPAIGPTGEAAASSPAHVNNRAFISFADSIGPDARRDVIDSMLLAELVADQVSPRQADVEAWYGQFVEVLRQIGWPASQLNRVGYQARGDTVTVDQVALEVLGAALTGDQLAVVAAALTALKDLSKDDRPVVLFDRQTHDAHAGNFQVALAEETSGTPRLSLGAFDFHTEDTVEQILWFDFSTSRTTIFKATDSIELDMGVYDRVRDAVREKLGQNAEDYVAGLPKLHD